MNYVILVGRTVGKPNTYYTQNGKAVTFLTIACDGYCNRASQGVASEFIPLTIWGEEAERCKELERDSLVRVTGRVSIVKSEQSGRATYSGVIVGEDVVLLEKPRNGAG